MNGIQLRWPAAAAAAALLLGAGAGAAYFVLIHRGDTAALTAGPGRARGPAAESAGGAGQGPGAPGAAGTPSAHSEAHPGVAAPRSGGAPATVTIGDEVARRAGITLTPVAAGGASGERRVPAVIEANAYHQVAVTALLAGRITQVFAGLGDRVRTGQPLARVFSPGLAEAESQYIAARAELDAHERELQRTETLVQIGAASRQELERTHAEHAARKAGLDSARSRLHLLGVDEAVIDGLTPGASAASSLEIRAPLAGVVTERAANPGLNVETGTKLFTIVDLSTVWVLADLYEQDFAKVRVGDPVEVAIPSAGAVSIPGRVAYIDPQVSLETRTARVRVEIPNPGGAIRLGAFAELRLKGPVAAGGLLVPRTAIQRVGDQTVVYVAVSGRSGTFQERPVRLGQTTGANVEILAGLAPGDTVVSEGSFFVRAERERTQPRGIIEAP